MVRLIHTSVAGTFAAVALLAAFGGALPGLEMELWQFHMLAAFVCGCSAAASIAWRRPYLYGLFVIMALLIPLAGPALVLAMGQLAKRESMVGVVSPREPFIDGVPLRESTRGGQQGQAAPLVSRYRSLNSAQLEAILGDVIKLDDAPLMSLNRKFRDHPDTRIRLLGQACLADRLNKLDRQVRDLERRFAHDAEDSDALLGLCEIHLAVLDQRLLMPQECLARARTALETVRSFRIANDASRLVAVVAFYEAQFALHSGDREEAVGAWVQLVEVMEQRRVVNPGDRYNLLGAEVSLLRGDLSSVREHIRRLEPDRRSKFWLQEFWLEPVSTEVS